MKKALYKSIQSYAKDLAKCSEQIASKFAPDIIHALRTTFKKLRALLRWQKANKKIYLPFKKLYDVAGEIRVAQVAGEMLNKEGATPRVFKKWLAIRSVEKKKRWDKFYDEKILSRLQQKLEDLRVHRQGNACFFKKRIKEIGQIINADPVADTALHDIRKKLKDMQYTLEWHKNKSNPKDLTKMMPVAQLKNIGKQIGTYNDTRMLLVLLNTYVKQENKNGSIDTVNPLIHKWRQNKAAQKEKLLQQLRRVNGQPAPVIKI